MSPKWTRILGPVLWFLLGYVACWLVSHLTFYTGYAYRPK